MGEAEMSVIGKLIADVLKNPEDKDIQAAAKDKVADLCRRYPLYK
jgi:glycine hydroxymethyltransferase